MGTEEVLKVGRRYPAQVIDVTGGDPVILVVDFEIERRQRVRQHLYLDRVQATGDTAAAIVRERVAGQSVEVEITKRTPDGGYLAEVYYYQPITEDDEVEYASLVNLSDELLRLDRSKN